MSTPHDTLCAAIETFLNANDYLPHMFKLQFDRDATDTRLRDGLRSVIDNAALDPQKMEDLTDAAFDTPADVDAFLRAAWTYVYENGPEPDLPG